jgi:hypothetical protein
LEKLKVKGVNSRFKTFRKALRSVWSEEKIQEVERRLAMFRDTINLRVLVNFRYFQRGFSLYSRADFSRTQFDLVTLRLEGKFDNLDANATSLLDAIIECRNMFETKLEAQTETLKGFHANTDAAVVRAHEETRSHLADVLRISDVVSQNRYEATQRESEKLQATMLQVVEEMKKQRALIERLQLERQEDLSLQERLDLQERLNTAYAVLVRLAIVLAGLQISCIQSLQGRLTFIGSFPHAATSS